MMAEIWDGLVLMFRDLDVVAHDDNQYAAFIFALGCGILGALTVILDALFYFLKQKSMLNLKHGWATVGLLIAWSLAAVITGFFGQILNIFVVSITASAVVGIAWPVLFIKVVENSNKAAESEQI